jgi:pimeloyl-ACP methyl ester carboxylesterase
MEIQTGTVPFRNGEIFYRKTSGKSKYILIFIHGAGGDSTVFQKQLEGLGEAHTVVAVDLPGHGKSQSPVVPDITTYRDAITALIESFSPARAVIAGHSMGGGIIFEVAKAAPDKVAGLIFLTSSPVLPVSDMIFDSIDKDFNAFTAMITKLCYSSDVDQSVFNASVERMKKQGAGCVRNDFMICRNFNYKDLAAKLNIPVLIVATKLDKMVPLKLSEEFAGMMPQARLAVLDAKGHTPYIEQADMVNSEIKQFMDSIK